MSETVVRFSPHQKLPPGYRVEWWESDEHYHWVRDDGDYSVELPDRWSARRAAWAHYRGFATRPAGAGDAAGAEG